MYPTKPAFGNGFGPAGLQIDCPQVGFVSWFLLSPRLYFRHLRLHREKRPVPAHTDRSFLLPETFIFLFQILIPLYCLPWPQLYRPALM